MALLQGHANGVSAVAFSPDGNQVLTASFDKILRIWDNRRQPLWTLKGHTGLSWPPPFLPTAGPWPPPVPTRR